MIRKPVVAVVAACGVLLTAGCASHEYVDHQLGLLAARHDAALHTAAEKEAADAADAKARAAAAHDRANAAYTLAQGKFVYATVLTDAEVSFDDGRADLSDAGKTHLTAFATRMAQENRNVFVEIRGYTDDRGTADRKAVIGQARAEAVRLFLADHGVALNRMAAVSYADRDPVAPNTTAEGRAQNRRVMIRVVQ